MPKFILDKTIFSYLKWETIVCHNIQKLIKIVSLIFISFDKNYTPPSLNRVRPLHGVDRFLSKIKRLTSFNF